MPDDDPPEVPVDPVDAIDARAEQLRLFELYSSVQVQADVVYHNRTSVITLAEGLLLVAYQSVLGKDVASISLVGAIIAIAGLTLSILWILFEQRNAAYFEGRASVLQLLEERLSDAPQFVPFWTAVPSWVKENAKWYQRVSAPLIQRFLIPGLFVVIWSLLLTAAPYIFRADLESQKRSEPSLVVRSYDVIRFAFIYDEEARSSTGADGPIDIGVDLGEGDNARIRSLVSDLLACGTEEVPTEVEVVGFASSSAFIGAPEEATRLRNLEAANRRAENVAAEIRRTPGFHPGKLLVAYRIWQPDDWEEMVRSRGVWDRTKRGAYSVGKGGLNRRAEIRIVNRGGCN